jgi:hypothetical protein
VLQMISLSPLFYFLAGLFWLCTHQDVNPLF